MLGRFLGAFSTPPAPILPDLSVTVIGNAVVAQSNVGTAAPAMPAHLAPSGARKDLFLAVQFNHLFDADPNLPTMPPGQGWTSLYTTSSSQLALRVIAKYAATASEAFGAAEHTTRVVLWQIRIDPAPATLAGVLAAAIASVSKTSGVAATKVRWAGVPIAADGAALILTALAAKVDTSAGHRDDTVSQGMVPATGNGRVLHGRSNGAVGAWAQQDVSLAAGAAATQTLSVAIPMLMSRSTGGGDGGGGTILTVSNPRQLRDAVSAAAAGAVIHLGEGGWGDIDLSGLAKTDVLVRSEAWQDPDPDTWSHINGSSSSGEAVDLTDSTGITLEYVRITGAKHQSRNLFTANGSTRCGLRRALLTGGGCQLAGRKARSLQLEFITGKDCFVDYGRFYEDCDGLRIWRASFLPHDTDFSHGLHTDGLQFACNGQNRGTWGAEIAYCRFQNDLPGTGAGGGPIQTILVYHESIAGKSGGAGAAGMPSKAHKDLLFREIEIVSANQKNGLGLCGVDGAEVDRLKITAHGTVSSQPCLNFYGRYAKNRGIDVSGVYAPVAHGRTDWLATQNQDLAEGASSIAAATISTNPSTYPPGWLGIDVGHLATDPNP